MASKSKRIVSLLNSASPFLLLGTASALLGGTPALAFDANSLPSGGTVTGGAASIAQSGNTMTVNQSSNRAVIDWRSFDIGANAQANFNQPDAGSIAVNRVNAGTDPSRIDGGLHANGQVWILNPNGVMFGKTARVDAAGVVATTANIDDKAFMAGDNKLQMRGGDTGAVVNEGHITVGEGGLAAFVAPSVRNSGSIRARVGKVALAAGDTYTLDLAGDRLVEIGLGAGKAVVDQAGQIVNEGGTVTISAKAAGAAVDSLINMSGLTDASAVQTAGGQIILGGDDINVASSAVLKADGVSGGQITSVAGKAGSYAGSYSAQATTGDGGQIETSGKTVHIDRGIAVNTTSAQGKTGNWTLDPDDLTVQSGSGDTLSGSGNADGESSIDADTVVTALDTTDVTLQARNSITVNSAIDASSNANAHNLTLADQNADNNLTINLNAVIRLNGALSGDGSTVNVGATGLIQNGIDVASLSGAPVVNLANGATYREQVVIAKNLTLNGGNATLESPDILAHSFSSGGIARKAVVSVENADVDISDLTVDGRGQGNANNYFIGVGLHNANSTLSGLTVTGTRDGGAGGSIGGAQHGVGIAVYNDDDTSRTVSVHGGAISDFQKIGAIFTGHGLSANIDNVAITGAGATSVNAQNGIELIGATGTISNNIIGGIGYSPDTVWATAIYLDDAAGATVSGNTVNGAGGIAGSTLGLYAGDSNNLTISGNSFLNVEEGIDVASANAHITGNHFTNGGSGIEIEDTATGLSVTGNDFTNNIYQIYADFAADLNPLIGANSFDRSVINDASGTTLYGDLQTAIDDEAAGSTLNLAGTFAAGATVNKAGDILSGQGAVINVSTGKTGLTIAADNVTVEGIEFAGNVATPYTATNWSDAAYQGVTAIAVSGNTSTGPSGFNLTGNNIHDVRTGIIVQGASASGSITGNTVENTKGGILIQYNDGAPYTISGNSEGAVGNEWGIVVNLNTAGINSPGAAPLSAQQNLLALADANGGMAAMDRHYAEANRTRVVVDASSTATAADDGGYGNGLGNARQALSSIQDGVKAVVAGGTVNVKDGSYTLANELDITRSLTLKGQSEAGTEITSNSTGYGINVTADNVSLQNFTYHGPAAATGSSYGIKVTPDSGAASDRLLNFDIENVTIDRGYRTGLDLNGVVGATIKNVSVSNIVHGNGIALTDSADVTITNTATGNNAWGGLALYQTNDFYDQQVDNISVDGSNSFNDTIPVYAEDESASLDFGAIALAGFGYVVQSPNLSTDVYSWFQKTQQDAVNFATDAALSNNNINLATATVQGYGGSGVNGDNHFTVGIGANSAAMSVNVALDQSAAGGVVDVLSGTYAEDVSLVAPRTVNFDDVALNSLTVTSTGAGATLSGKVAAGSVVAFDINLGGDLALDTSAAGGTIALGNVDGAHALTLNAGSGAVLVGGIGATTRVGAVDITADLIALGATNKAASFAFNGDVALSEASTLIDTTVSSTAAGDITFGGDIFGLTDGGQSLVLSAGPGTGAASANGDIAMNNAGLSAVRLGNLSVSGNNFTALTVDLAGDFTSHLTGNQVFAADTLNAGGNVTTQVAGDASGHVVAGGNITMDAGGNVSGTISGQAVTLTAGNTVSGTISGQTVTLTGQAVNTQVTATTLNVVAKSGTVTGTFTPGTVSNGLSLNGQVTGGTGNTGGGATTVQFPTVNGQQLVVENFLLPAGTQVAADGTLILPTGLVIGLLSPGGGPARVIMVNDVRTLGQLLSEGYSAIVIDLNAKKSGEVQVASN